MSFLPSPTTSPRRTPTAFLDVMRGDFDGGDLEIEELIAEILGNAVLDDAFAGFL